MRRYIAYTRVSTARQGEKGSSLPEQKSIIEGYARREGLAISAWFEERETAAKVGRTIFKQMMQVFQRGGAEGLILHKIDRGARNLKDWALLSDLTDSGVDVRIAGDSIDMTSRGGRLSADIQAVVAADYIRNLREEVKKGQRGRLKAGLYPWAAPFGYLDTGEGGREKVIDPVQGPIVRRAFEYYSSGHHTLRTLALEIFGWGVTGRTGKPLSLNRLNLILRREFYIGLIKIKGETYIGKHEPLIPKVLFDEVQSILDGRSGDRVFGKHEHTLRRLVRCGICAGYLYAEVQKGRSYYRCHKKTCFGTCLRESSILDRVTIEIQRMGMSDAFLKLCKQVTEEIKRDAVTSEGSERRSLALQLASMDARSRALTDAYLDRVLDREEYEERKRAQSIEMLSLRERLQALDADFQNIDAKAGRFFELVLGLQNMKNLANSAEKRELLQSALSNLSATKKTLDLQWKNSLTVIVQASSVRSSGDARYGYRTFSGSEEETELARTVMREVLFGDDSTPISPPPMSVRPDVQHSPQVDIHSGLP